MQPQKICDVSPISLNNSASATRAWAPARYLVGNCQQNQLPADVFSATCLALWPFTLNRLRIVFSGGHKRCLLRRSLRALSSQVINLIKRFFATPNRVWRHESPNKNVAFLPPSVASRCGEARHANPGANFTQANKYTGSRATIIWARIHL